MYMCLQLWHTGYIFSHDNLMHDNENPKQIRVQVNESLYNIASFPLPPLPLCAESLCRISWESHTIFERAHCLVLLQKSLDLHRCNTFSATRPATPPLGACVHRGLPSLYWRWGYSLSRIESEMILLYSSCRWVHFQMRVMYSLL